MGKIFDGNIFDPKIFDIGARICVIAATEALDTCAVVVAGGAITQPAGGGKWNREAMAWWISRPTIYPTLYARIDVTEMPDGCFMIAERDYIDDDLIMALMSAAWDEEFMEVLI